MTLQNLDKYMKSRRKVLAAIGTGTGIALAGCTADDTSDDEGSDDDEETSEYPNDTHTHEPEGDSIDWGFVDLEQRTGNDVFIVGQLSNPLGRPIYRMQIRFNFVDEIDNYLDFERVEIYGLRHGGTWNFEKEWDGTLDDKVAAVAAETELARQEFANPQIPEMGSEECGNVDDWMCDGKVTISSVNEGFVTTGVGSEAWTVSGEISAIADDGDNIYTVVAQYLRGGEIVASESDAVPIFPTGGTNDFRIEFEEGQPQGSLRMTLLDDIQLE